MSNHGSDIEDSSVDELRAASPSRKRKRLPKISCELCKSRKVKCDRQEPKCGWCASHDRICIYRERKRPGVRAAYELDLEEKVNRLETMLQTLKTEVDDHIANDHVADVGDFELTARQRMASVEQDLPWLTASRTKGWSRGRDGTAMRYLPVSIDHVAEDGDLPPYDLLYELVDLYFKHVATWSPILDRKHTFNILFGHTPDEPHRVLLHAIVAVSLRFSKDPRLTPAAREHYHSVSKTKVQLYGLENANIPALQALVVLAIDILGTSNSAQGWNLLALIARNVVQLGLNVEKSVYLAAAPYPSISCLGAFAVSQPMSWTENEARRRLLWMVYVLDRYTTVSTSFNFALNDGEIDRPLPCSYDLFSQNEPVETKWFDGPESSMTTINHVENLGSFAYHCEVLRILSRIHKFLNQPVDITSHEQVEHWKTMYTRLDAELNYFLIQLPGEYGKISQLCHSDPASKIANWIMLHAAFVLSIIRLHSAAAFPIVSSPLLMPSQQAAQRCLTAVDSLQGIAQDVIDSNGLDLLGPPFAFCLWVSARVLLVHATTTHAPIDPRMDFFITTLHAMGQCWDVAHRYATVLAKVVAEGQLNLTLSTPYQHHHNNNNNSNTNHPKSSNNSTRTTSKSYSTMRRHAYELNQLAAQKPRSVLTPTSTRLTGTNELEYLDIFDFFNYPKIPSASSSVGGQLATAGVESPVSRPAAGRDVARFDAVEVDAVINAQADIGLDMHGNRREREDENGMTRSDTTATDWLDIRMTGK